MTKTCKVEVHVSKSEHVTMVSFITTPLSQSGIKYTIVVDKVTLKRKYPFITVNGRMLCLKRTIHASRGCSV